ncbi:hypothetical protein [Streptomyces phaeochromogenes]|uniref:hypothetical protein n=1 Tax=Streptomyces phaeochromogenes TaxID=1923 RepID=UPI003F4CE853
MRSKEPFSNEQPLTDEELARGLADGDEACLAAVHRGWSALVHTLAPLRKRSRRPIRA